MTTVPEVIRHSELINQLVLNRTTLEEFGRVEILWMYPPAHRVLGFICKSGFLGNQKSAFKLSQIEAIGVNGILTRSQPDATDAERVRQLESLIHSEVWSNGGEKVGKIIDCVFNLRSGAISDYLVVGDRLSKLAGTIYRLPINRISSLGHKRVLVSDRTIQSFPLYREGIQQKISKASNAVKDDYTQVTQELRSIAQRAQDTRLQTTSQLRNFAEQAKDRAQLLAEQAKERAQELNEQIREGAETFVEQAKETTETLVERLQEQAESLGGDSTSRDATVRPGTNRSSDNAEFEVDSWFEDEFEDKEDKFEKANPDDLIIDEIEEIFEEIEDIFGVSTSPVAKVPVADVAPPNPDASWIEDLPWSAEKVEFWDGKKLDQWDVHEDDDPWDITELPPPTNLIIPLLDVSEFPDLETGELETEELETEELEIEELAEEVEIQNLERSPTESSNPKSSDSDPLETIHTAVVEVVDEEEERSLSLPAEPEPKQTIVVEVVRDKDDEPWI
ncbi:hypothetical protein JOY44_14250 [Phormidium sp. CLA17]|uniref:hypothetical protein n=1 Tax=Leptolyngbya sp. Cla-17 TaxID=2803751 RepID=UPI0014932305|nr:hypothetical protein [Leptolyngbya sp. Cla-17]MBM0742754.1 hypothetical protein [Leptolyngbya sp. Cla-17]